MLFKVKESVKRIVDGATIGSIYEEIFPLTYCCAGMEKALLKGYIQFGDAAGDEDESGINTVNIFERFHNKPVPITYCPFCGEKIEIQITKRSLIKYFPVKREIVEMESVECEFPDSDTGVDAQ